MKRYLQYKIQLVDNTTDGEAKTALRAYFKDSLAEMATFHNEDGRFMVWIDIDSIKAELFKYKVDFIPVPNICGNETPINLWSKITKERVTYSNYMDIEWTDMIDYNPNPEEDII